MKSLVLPQSAKRVRDMQGRIAASRNAIARMPVALRLSAHRTHRNAMRVGLVRLVDALTQDANRMPAISAQRLRLEDVACELDQARVDDLVLDARARQVRGELKLRALEDATCQLLDRVSGWALVLEDPLAAMRRRRVVEAR